jgi:hypothetical protein
MPGRAAGANCEDRVVTDLARRGAAGLCGLGAVGLLGSTFLDWYAAGRVSLLDPTPNAWQAFRGVDLVLTVCMAVALVAVLALLRRRRDAVAMARLAAAVALVALGLVVWRALDPPLDGAGVRPGLWVGAAALIAIAAGGALGATRRDR